VICDTMPFLPFFQGLSRSFFSPEDKLKLESLFKKNSILMSARPGNLRARPFPRSSRDVAPRAIIILGEQGPFDYPGFPEVFSSTPFPLRHIFELVFFYT